MKTKQTKAYRDGVGQATFSCLALLLLLGLAVACGRRDGTLPSQQQESREAKALLQGVWIDQDTEELTFRAVGDTIFFPDSTSQAAYFQIVGDSLVLGAARSSYFIEKQTEHQFWFINQNGDLIKLVKSDDPETADDFVRDETPAVMTYTEVVKRDSVVVFNRERFHWYVAINPTKYKVHTTTYGDNGVEVDNVYYDNIMHISVFCGTKQLFSQDFKKQMYAATVPAQFLEQAILANMEYSRVDEKGLHFDATLCIPGDASCYRVENVVSFDGKLTTNLLEY